MKQFSKPERETPAQEERITYEAPAIIYEGKITTRAGTPTTGGNNLSPNIDPADLFGDSG